MEPLILSYKLLTLWFISDRLMQVLNDVSRAMIFALRNPHPQRRIIMGVLRNLTRLENRPSWLAKMTYGWCAVIWENRQGWDDWEKLLLLSLEVGFRHLASSDTWNFTDFVHTEYHQELVDTVLRSNEGEAVTDLVYASCAVDQTLRLPLGICTTYITKLCGNEIGPFSPRLRRVFAFCVGTISSAAVEEVGQEKFTELLNCLHLEVEDLEDLVMWTDILLKIIQSPMGIQHLDVQSWELLVEAAIRGSFVGIAYNTWTPDATASLTSLLESQGQWEKLECWMGVIWIVSPPEPDGMSEDFERAMASLFRQRPGAVRKLARWMERWSKEWYEDIPESFHQMCRRGREEAP